MTPEEYADNIEKVMKGGSEFYRLWPEEAVPVVAHLRRLAALERENTRLRAALERIADGRHNDGSYMGFVAQRLLAEHTLREALELPVEGDQVFQGDQPAP